MGTATAQTLGELARVVGGSVDGDATMAITGVAGIREAQPGDITFVAHHKYLRALQASKASAVILDRRTPADRPAIRVDQPYLAFATLLTHYYPRPRPAPGIREPVTLGKRVQVGKDVTLFPLVTLGDDVTLGDAVVLYPGVFVGSGSSIGDHTVIYPNVSIYDRVSIGRRVVIQAGAVLGSDGFGYVQGPDGRHHKIPQVGGIRIEDDVEIGANVCIDRATVGETIIRRGTKIDNLVHIAHNVEVGEDNLLLAHVGISGSCRLGTHVTLAGQVGLIDHVTVGDNATIIAQSGIAKDVETNAVMAGTVAMPHGLWRRVQVAIPRLPELLRTVRALEQRIAALEASLARATKDTHDG
ncbi:MAG: UDP-3-O-(3-hydroxymyristoyl)glucosamine N-acyltransferase [Nitrospinae bacterium]|nr:UDP-3-O-(3-hydroxymyristoyl)glucosamine N-acyltransferase [Nitrospinota bacterium]